MAVQEIDKVESIIGGSIFAVLLILLFMALAIVASPFLLLDFLGKKLFRIKQMDLEDSPEWNKSGGRGYLF